MFYQLLDSIKQKPALFLNQQSASGLHAFLLGFQAAKNLYQLPPDDDERDFAGFQEWIARRYEISTNQSWPRIISFFARDERDSLELFFKLLEVYKDRSLAEYESPPADEVLDEALI
jgi:hypothetical protein